MSRYSARRAAGALCLVSLVAPVVGATPPTPAAHAPPASATPSSAAAPPVAGVVKNEGGLPLPHVDVIV